MVSASKTWFLRLLTVSVFISVLLTTANGDTPGKARWSIKTSVPANADLEHPIHVDLQKLLSFKDAPGVTKDDPRYKTKRIPMFKNDLGIKEGDIISTEGWLYLVAHEPDGDYHMQISNSDKSGNNCLIVEVPMDKPEFVKSKLILEKSREVRQFVQQNILNGKDSNKTKIVVLKKPVHVKVEGQLFYDDWHVGDAPRGKKGMKAATLWEIHPVTKME